MKRPTTICARCDEVEMIIMPMLMMTPPVNILFRRPSLSERTAANGEPTIAPLQSTATSVYRLSQVRRTHTNAAERDRDVHDIERENDSSAGSDTLNTEGCLEVRHGNDGRHEGAIISVGASTIVSQWEFRDSACVVA